MKAFARFLSSNAGRMVRIVAGLALMAWGLADLGGNAGTVVAVIGALPLVTGLIDICALAPLFGVPFRGKQARAVRD